MNRTKLLRRRFYRGLLGALKLVWPIMSILLITIAGLGLIVGYLEAWHPLEGIYFAFVTGLTVGYGDLVPKRHASRILAVAIGFTGLLLTAIFAAISVRALEGAVDEEAPPPVQPDGQAPEIGRNDE